MSENVTLNKKQTMLAFALKARGVKPQNTVTIIMILENDDQIDDLVWYMNENPDASEENLVSVAFQIVKDAHEEK